MGWTHLQGDHRPRVKTCPLVPQNWFGPICKAMTGSSRQSLGLKSKEGARCPTGGSCISS